MGSPTFALPSLNALDETYGVQAVFTQPDRRAGRGRQLQEPPVKARATELGIPIYQPSSLKDPKIDELINDLSPDVIVVAAYGQILPADILKIPRVGCINVHASLLPRWRGAAPVQAAIYAGDPVTGISIMKMDQGLDTGPIYTQESLEITDSETGGELTTRLAEIGSSLLIQSLPEVVSGKLLPSPQDETLATYAPMLKKADGWLDFNRPAIDLERQIRAYEPWPSSYFIWRSDRIVVRRAEAIANGDLPPGTCHSKNRVPAIAANPGTLLLHIVQPAGKRAMQGKTFLNGAKDFLDGRISHDSTL